IAKKVCIRSINKKSFDIMLFYIMRVSLLNVEEVFIWNILFVRSVTLAYVRLQTRNRSMKVDQQIRLHELLVDDVEQPLVEPELIVRQCNLRKQQAFREEVIRNRQLLKHVLLLKQFFELFEPFRHEEQFERKGILLRVFIKLGKKRIVSEFFEDQPRVVMFRQQMCQRGLPRSNIAFDCYEIIFHELCEP